MGESAIRAGIDTAINNTDFADSFTNSLRGAIVNDIGAIAANNIGDLGLTYDLDNGGITKTTLHGISQGVVAELAGGDFQAGMAAGIATELTGDLIGNIEDKNTQVGVAGLIGATAGVIATGDAEGAYTGQSAGQTVHQFNHLNHTEKVELELAKVKCNSGDDDACNRRDELNRLDYERDQTLRVACSVGSAEECNAQIEFAQENYASYEVKMAPFDDIAIGQERESIKIVLDDPDGSKRQADQDFVDDFPANAITTVGVGCSILLAGSCAALAGAGEIGIEVLDYFSGIQKGELNTDSPLGGKPIIGALNEGVSSEISKLPIPRRTEMLLQGINVGFGVVIDEVVDNEKE